ncbi:TonB-dependent receptor plug domain-containing protein [Arcobacter sp.]|uniref:TonB-dependent receptor plug domain-containing protein n=1 Tax=Arcobacter sp. TaxID=1872629 RepID=UPI003D0CF1A3
MKLFILLFLFFSTLFSQSLESLLDEYEETTKKSLTTVDEKMGHIRIYSQKEIQLMQYNKLSDILKELPLFNLNKNRFGVGNPSLAGSKTVTSGFFRFFIDDHEVSSAYSKSPFLSWGDLPLDFIDHIEIYYGESSFALANDSGIYFIRLYTKSPQKENGAKLTTNISNNASNSNGLTYASTLGNDWSYLIYLNNTKIKDDDTYKGKKLSNNSSRKYLYLDVQNDTTIINFGYSDVTKDNYMGQSKDIVPNSGEIFSKDYYVDITKYFLDDNSIKANFSIGKQLREYSETNDEKIFLVPFLFSAYQNITQANEKLEFTKTNAYISKTFQYKDNNFLAGLSLQNKSYKVKSRTIVNSNTTVDVGQFNDFDKESVRSVLFQDDYKIKDDLIFIANAKYDKYKRRGFLKDSSTNLYRIGGIYTPFENFGLKSFYTETTIPQLFSNIDFAFPMNKNLKDQKYRIFTVEGVFTTENSKFGITYDHVDIEDFIYYASVGFVNVDHTIKTDGWIFDYEYIFSDEHELKLNYYLTSLSETANNSQRGGFIKYMGRTNNFEYFTSLNYKSAFDYTNVHVSSAFDFSLGATYNISKNMSLSLKGENLLDKSTKSLNTNEITKEVFATKDYGRSVNMTLKWVF